MTLQYNFPLAMHCMHNERDTSHAYDPIKYLQFQAFEECRGDGKNVAGVFRTGQVSLRFSRLRGCANPTDGTCHNPVEIKCFAPGQEFFSKVSSRLSRLLLITTSIDQCSVWWVRYIGCKTTRTTTTARSSETDERFVVTLALASEAKSLPSVA